MIGQDALWRCVHTEQKRTGGVTGTHNNSEHTKEGGRQDSETAGNKVKIGHISI